MILLLLLGLTACSNNERIIREGKVARIESTISKEGFWGHDGNCRIIYADSTFIVLYDIPDCAMTGDSIQLVEKKDFANGTYMLMRIKQP